MPELIRYSSGGVTLCDTFSPMTTTTATTTTTKGTSFSPMQTIPSVSKYVGDPNAVFLNCYTNSVNEKCIPVSVSVAVSIPMPNASVNNKKINEKLFEPATIITWNCNSHTKCFIENCTEISLKSLVFEKEEKVKNKFSFHWPIFILFISILEICIFVYDYVTLMKKSSHNGELVSSSGTGSTTSIITSNIITSDNSIYVGASSDSLLIYRPDRRLQVWRFISYMLLHANWFHLCLNIVTQLVFGLPLEMMHGALRVGAIYFAGVFAGSLGTSVVDSAAYLVGASGGVYALLAAQLANISINFERMRYGIFHLSSLIIFVFCDLGYALYTKYNGGQPIKMMPTSISYIAHLTGSLAGFTIGLLILKHFDIKSKSKSNFISWLAFSLCMSFLIFAIVFNLFNTITAQRFEEQSETIKKDFLHNFGIS